MQEDKPQKGAYFTVGMLFFFMFVNFADKAVLGLTAVPMMKELNLTPKEFGLIASSFFLFFAVSTVVVGFLVNRIETRWALFVMSLVWALAQFPIVGSAGLATLIVSRVVLGAGEGPAYPVALHALFKWFPNEKRTLPTALISQGAAIGVMVALPALGWIVSNYSWRWAYGALGIVGLVWCSVWLAFGREGNQQSVLKGYSGNPVERIDYLKLIRTPTVIANALTWFGAYWALSLLVAWFTPFLIAGLGLEPATAHFVSAIPWATSAIVVISCGLLSQRMILNGAPTRFARGVFCGACVAAGGLAFIALPFVPGLWPKVILAIVGFSFPPVAHTLCPAVLGEIIPTNQRGAMLAMNVAFVTLAGLIAPYAMGSAVQDAVSPTAGYAGGFLTCGLISLFCGIVGMLFIRPGTEIERFTPSSLDFGSKPIPTT